MTGHIATNSTSVNKQSSQKSLDQPRGRQAKDRMKVFQPFARLSRELVGGMRRERKTQPTGQEA